MAADIVMMIAVCVTVIFALYQAARIIRSFAMHRTIREALLRGSELTPALLAQMEEPARAPRGGDERSGMILLALSLALFGFGVLTNSEDGLRTLSGAALFPFFVGLALLGRMWLVRRRGGDA